MKNKFYLISLLSFVFFSQNSGAQENCTSAKKIAVCPESLIVQRVADACTLLETEGVRSLIKINSTRFECCGEPNYVWINDLSPRMIIHPMKPNLNGMDLSEEADPKGKFIFKEFAAAASKNPAGSWVSYQWTLFGESTPSAKKSWVRLCKAKDHQDSWVVGSGTWE